MIELPEALNLAKELAETVGGKIIEQVLPPTKTHKFCWFNGDPTNYGSEIGGQQVCSAEGFGIYVEMVLSGGHRLCFNNGVNVRFVQADQIPKDYQLVIQFSDSTALVFTVAMYGAIILHDGDYDSEYYLKSRQAVSPFLPGFRAHYDRMFRECKPSLSAKGFLAAEQRFLGVGNGVSQDVLFFAGINPKRKIATFSEKEQEGLLSALTSVLTRMTEQGGRDTEKDLFGLPRGYKTRLSKQTLSQGCPICGGMITKEVYLGGSVYYCLHCQPLT